MAATAIGLAALSTTCLFALVAGLKADLAANLQRYTAGQILVEDRGLARAEAHALTLAVPGAADWGRRFARHPGVTGASPRITGAASVFVDGDAVLFPFLGLDFASDPLGLGEFLGPGGRLPAPGQREALVSTGLALQLGLKVGSTLTLVTSTRRGSTNGMTLRVTGLVHPALASFQAPWLFAPLDTVDRLVHLDGGATSLLVAVRPGVELGPLAADLEADLASAGLATVTARPWYASSASAGLLDTAQVLYAFIGLVFAALASTVVVNTMLMVVLERAGEIGMLGALGMDGRTIRRLFLAEGALLAGAGAAGGTAVGVVLSLVWGQTGLDYGQALQGVQFEMSTVLRPLVEPWLPVEVFVLTTAVALLFTLIPVARIRNLAIVDALKGDLS